jgi:hypothetical protein
MPDGRSPLNRASIPFTAMTDFRVLRSEATAQAFFFEPAFQLPRDPLAVVAHRRLNCLQVPCSWLSSRRRS